MDSRACLCPPGGKSLAVLEAHYEEIAVSSSEGENEEGGGKCWLLAPFGSAACDTRCSLAETH